jgi:LytR cell envelope-related transcriptional attenuator
MASAPPDPSPTNHLSVLRAGLVLVGFLVAVTVLVAVGTRPTVSGDALAPVTTTTVAGGHHATTSTTTTTVPHSSVSVVVANATSTSGLAAHYTTVLTAQGWDMQTPTDASTTVANSVVYYAAGQSASAGTVAATLGLKPAAVQPLTSGVPVAGVGNTDVVVIIGADLVAGA